MQRAPILAVRRDRSVLPLQNGREAFRSVSRPSGYTKITGIKTIVDYDQVSLWHRLQQMVIRRDVTVAALLPEGKVRSAKKRCGCQPSSGVLVPSQ